MQLTDHQKVGQAEKDIDGSNNDRFEDMPKWHNRIHVLDLTQLEQCLNDDDDITMINYFSHKN